MTMATVLPDKGSTGKFAAEKVMEFIAEYRVSCEGHCDGKRRREGKSDHRGGVAGWE